MTQCDASRPRRRPPASGTTVILVLATLALLSGADRALACDFDFGEGFCKEDTLGTQVVARGTHLSGKLVRTAWVPSIGVVGAPNPSIDWGDGATSAALLAETVFLECTQCALYGDHVYDKAGNFTIKVTYYTGALISYTEQIQVEVKEPKFTIVSLGDSVASGEGVPDLDTNWAIDDAWWRVENAELLNLIPTAQEAQWYGNAGCHRSEGAAPRLAADMLWKQNREYRQFCFPFPVPPLPQCFQILARETPVLFLSEACSGAKLTTGGDNIRSQVAKIATRLTALKPEHKPVDVALISGGANDIGGGFGSIVKSCVLAGGDCATEIPDLGASFAGLPGKYQSLDAEIRSRLAPSDVFITEYYDPTRHSDGGFGPAGSTCLFDNLPAVEAGFVVFKTLYEEQLPTSTWNWNSSTWRWLYDNVQKPLNDGVAAGATANGWHYVGGIASAFRRHGICAYLDGTPWVVGVRHSGSSPKIPYLESVYIQKDVQGTGHPNATGQGEIAKRIVEEISRRSAPSTVPEVRFGGGGLLTVPERQYDVDKFGSIVVRGAAVDGLAEDGHRLSVLEKVAVELSPQAQFPVTAGTGSSFYALTEGSSSCGPQSQGDCTTYGFPVTVDGLPGRTEKLQYFGCNKFDDAGGAGCETARTLQVEILTGTQIRLKKAGGADYAPGTWAREPVVVTLAPPGTGSAALASPSFLYPKTRYLLDPAPGAPACAPGDLPGCQVYGGPFTVSADGEHSIGYFTHSELTPCDALSALYGSGALPGCDNAKAAALYLPSRFPLLDTAVQQASFRIDRTPPAVALDRRSPAANAFGWNHTAVSVSWTCRDALSGAVSDTVSDTLTADGAGQTATGTCTDVAGNSATLSLGGINIDKVAPAVQVTVVPPPNASGWHKAPLSVSWTGSDALSGLQGCTSAVPYAGPDTPGLLLEGSCTDLAGNSASSDVTVRYDSVPPSVTAAAERPPDANGWYNHPMVVSWLGTDALSGIQGCSVPTLYPGPDSAAATVTGECSDVADNAASAHLDFRYDATPPVVQVALGRAPDVAGWYNHPVAVSATATDALSGVEACTPPRLYSGPDAADAVVAATCTDVAHNAATASAGFRYDATPPVVTYSGNLGTYGVLDLVAISCTATDNLSGVERDTCADVEGPAYNFVVGVNEFSAEAVDVAGNTATGSTRFELVVSSGDLIALVRQFVSHPGIANSLVSKLAAAQASSSAGHLRAKEGQLGAFRNELAAQSGKRLSPEQAQTLLRLSQAL
jgi:hypothetical protein